VLNVGSSRLSLPTSRGYPRLIEADEEGTLSLLKALRAEVIDLPMMTRVCSLPRPTCSGLLLKRSE